MNTIIFNSIPLEIQARIILATGHIVCKSHKELLINERIENAGTKPFISSEINRLFNIRREILALIVTDKCICSELYLPKIFSSYDNPKVSDIRRLKYMIIIKYIIPNMVEEGDIWRKIIS